jgi:hypothetical protein
MGKEAACTAYFGKRKSKGKVLLETSELLFRPANGGPRIKIPFSAIKSAQAGDGTLRLQATDGPVCFELGAVSEKWCQKILHPKTRAEKLGLKSGIHVSLLGDFDQVFLKELRATTENIHEGKLNASTELMFLSVNSTKDLLSAINKVAKSIRGSTSLWVAYPKGKKEITENEVLSAGRKAGLKDVKVVGFSSTHTALKFVVPVDKR